VSHKAKARRIILEAAEQVKALAHEALDAAAFGDARELVELAARIQACVADEDPTRATASAGEALGCANSDQDPAIHGRKSRTPLSWVYPKFYRNGKDLVRIAWSDSSRSEYEQKATYENIRTIADRLLSAGMSGSVFAVRDLMPIRSNGKAIPDYQVYVALSWFRDRELVEKRGHSKYQLTSLADGPDALERSWHELNTLTEERARR